MLRWLEKDVSTQHLSIQQSAKCFVSLVFTPRVETSIGRVERLGRGVEMI